MIILMLEYLEIVISSLAALFIYGINPMIAAVINRITLDWGRMRARKRQLTEAIRMERLLNNENA